MEQENITLTRKEAEQLCDAMRLAGQRLGNAMMEELTPKTAAQAFRGILKALSMLEDKVDPSRLVDPK